jgi:hypothetical protein
MKKLTLFFFLLLTVFSHVAAQTSADEKYTAGFKKALVNLDSSWASPPRMRETANQFERLANFKKTEWLPRYYHALCLIQYSWSATDAKEREAVLKAAETSIQTGMSLSPDSSEMVALEGYLYQAMIMINPMANGPVYGPKSAMTLQKAAALDPDNPRPHYLIGQNLYFTPEMWGGGMDKARPHLEKAKALFAAFKPKSEFHPNWGQVVCEMILDGRLKKD